MKATIFCVLVLGLFGCQSAPPSIAPGMSAVKVRVEAVPKSGARMPAQRVYVYDTPLEQKRYGDFAQVDYANLGNIVLWLEPAKAVTPDGTVHVGFITGERYGSLHAAAVGQKLILHNHSSHAEKLYSVSDGNEFETALIEPGKHAEVLVKAEGPIEILADSTKEPVADVYAAPAGAMVAEAHSGESVIFNDVPPGQCKVYAWHPRLPGTEKKLELAANRVNEVKVRIGVDELPKVK